MTSASLSILFRRAVRRNRWLQTGLLILFAVAGHHIAAGLGLPVPGGVIGMILVLALLASRRLKAGVVRRGSNLLLAEMLLFFVPAVMSLLDHGELIGLIGLKLLLIIVVGTAMVMGTTALVIDGCYRWSCRRAP